MLKAHCLAMAGLLIAAPAVASELSAEDIRREIIGRHIFLAAPLGGEFPLNYHPDGKVDGDGDAVGLGRLAQPKDEGRWWIADDRLCQRFESWYDGKPMCFVLTRIGDGQVAWLRDNGEKGTARIGGRIASR
ncbi:hypothetical protein KIP89_16575 [Ancylobacter sp. VKM B-3255]|uniref:Alkaline proteinase inhibitor/ Outer membrane lipoprotein Omp19 domain-containing protein n=2 Tax=Ancylobacter radicis TaxID=2836179 RepID=A0ABS5RCR2_9HYPH|nr:hypothetical protein [Ancylobacter radicis]